MDLIATITAKMKVDVEEGREEGREKSPHRFLIPSWVHLPLSLHFSSQLPPSLPPSPLSPQQRTKAYWTGKTEALRVLWHDLSRPNKEEEGLSPFNLLLRLLTYEDVLGELDEAFVREPASIEFYIPQLVTFLLYGAFWSSGSLQAFLLDKSGKSAMFAHRLYWFLKASCLDGSGINPEGRRQVLALIEDVKARGQRAAKRLEEGRTVQEEQQLRRWKGGTRSRESYFGEEGGSEGGRTSSGNTTTRSTRSFGGGGGGGDREGGLIRDDGGSVYVDIGRLQDGAAAAASTADVPMKSTPTKAHHSSSPHTPSSLPPSTSAPSPRPSLSASGRFPLEQGAFHNRNSCSSNNHDPPDLFDVLPRFLDALIDVSRDLMAVPRDRRNSTLRAGLSEIGRSFLPSNLVYMPVGNPYHRVWRVHAAESFAFSTKERVPCLVCLEVVDYAPPPRWEGGGREGGRGAGRKWWKQMIDGVGEGLPAITHTFKFGDKEWTLKIGEKGEGGKEGEKEGGGEDGGGMEENGEMKDDDKPLLSLPPATASLPPSSSSSPPLQPLQPLTSSSSSSSSVSVGVGEGGKEGMQSPVSSSGGVGMIRRMSSSSGLATIDGSGVGGMGQWASAEEGGGREGSEHVLLNVNQLKQQQQKEAVVTPRHEEGGGVGGVREEKEEAGAGGGSTLSDHYGTFSPHTSPDGSRRKEPLQQLHDKEGEEKEKETSSFLAAATTAVVATAAAASGGTRSTTPPPLLPPVKALPTSRSKDSRSCTSSSSATITSTAAAAAAAIMSPATAAAQAPVIFKERWKQKEARIRQRSQIGHLPGWRLVPVIVKSNDDLRQEQFASQLLHQIAQVLRHAEVPVWLRPYDIIATTFDGGLIEAIPDTVSLDALRRNDPNYTTLPDFFERFWGRGEGGGEGLGKARQCFLESLAAYSIVCFLLQVKDRHNGNILLDAEGHIIHIDFGFLLASSPGNVNFERAPFKLTAEMVDVLGGPRSVLFKRFRELCVKAYLELRRQRHKIILLVEMVVSGNENLPCFGGRPEATVEALRQRFQPELNDRACSDFVNGLIDDSVGSWSTRWYDVYQRAFVL